MPAVQLAIVSVAKVLSDPGNIQQLRVTWRKRIQIILKAQIVELSVRRNILRTSSLKNRLPLHVVGRGQNQRNERVPERDWLARMGKN